MHKRRKFNYSTKTKAYKERCKDFKHRNFVNIVIFINDLPVIKRQRKFYYIQWIVFFSTVVCNVIIYDLSGLCINRRDQITMVAVLFLWKRKCTKGNISFARDQERIGVVWSTLTSLTSWCIKICWNGYCISPFPVQTTTVV